MLLPNEHLVAAGAMYPDAWKQVDIFLRDKGKDLPDWPSWCFLPMAAWYAIVSGGGSNRLGPDMIGDVANLAAIGTWRYSQGIYRFDEDIYNALIETIPEGQLPSEVLYRLPEWSLYIETPNRLWFDEPMHGFWVHLEWDANTKRHELRLLLNTSLALAAVPIHIGDWTLTEAIDRGVSVAKENAKEHKLLAPPDGVTESVSEQIYELMSLVLYICSEEPEIDNDRQPGVSPSRPQPKKIKGGYRLFPADKPRVWSVGKLTGEQLRKQLELGENTGRSVKPHLRRAHWHTFWLGPRDGERKMHYKWLSPIVVGAKPEDK